MPASRSPSRDAKAARPACADAPLADDSHRPRGRSAPPSLPRCPPPSSRIFCRHRARRRIFPAAVWHGSAGKIRVNARDAGALEWWLHPAALLGMAVDADLHWVKVGFVIDAAVKIDRHGFAAHDIKGGGPIEDLRDLGVAAGWRGIAEIHLSELQGDFATPHSRRWRYQRVESRGAQLADGDGPRWLRPATSGRNQPAPTAASRAQLTDTGGPLEAQASLHYTAKDRARHL